MDAVENGHKAIEALEDKDYHLILMDVQMPEMNGFEATRVIREKEGERKHTPIIAMTAHAMKGDKERCLEAGMDDYIPKPIEPQKLFQLIEKWSKSPESRPSLSYQVNSKEEKSLNGVPINLENVLDRFDGDKEFF